MKRFCLLDCPICRDGICTECYAPEPAGFPSNEDWNRWLGTRPVRIMVTGTAPIDTHEDGFIPGSNGSWRVGAIRKVPVTPVPWRTVWLQRFAAYENAYNAIIRSDYQQTLYPIRPKTPMVNHPNRSKTPNASKTPTPAEIRAAREAAGLTQTEAADLVHSTCRSWQQWEADPSDAANHRRMHPAFFELFTLKVSMLKTLKK